ncbi:SigE family RNA polymerase sigma factor [Nocardioides speluncae]|uniref:SigE family RNA polymerase sigma factor n=1 Tax=Nocardioides speluncae TaxID=2670337 RepID=UPI000D687D2F|nr:SigE family RNA polymerase sigma factor [Nocardioides speluncae]
MAGPEEFEEFVAARTAALLRTAYLLTGNHHDAEDLVQTALVKVVPHWRRINGNPEAYVRRILVHENVSRWRRRRWREVSSERAPEPRAPSEPTDERLALQQALAKLAPRQRAVIVLRYFDDQTEAETARLLGVSVGTVKSQTRDALTRLRQHLPDLEGDWLPVPS